MSGLSEMLKTTRSRNLLIATTSVTVLLVLIITLTLFRDDEQPNDGQVDDEVVVVSAPSRTNINNFREYDINLPTARHVLIEQNLFETISMNIDAIDPLDINDVIIRDGSFKQSFDRQTQIYSTSFIVDIPSIRQSYKITDSYSSVESLSDYSSLVLCLDDKDLIYGSFDCMDRLRWESGE